MFKALLLTICLAISACTTVTKVQAETTAILKLEPKLLVANREMQGPYANTVLIVWPLGPLHFGLILNRPTKVQYAELFPNDPNKDNVKDNIYLGGPVGVQQIYAIAIITKYIPKKAFLLDEEKKIYLLGRTDEIDRAIKEQPEQLRLYAGMVVWKEGELHSELSKGWFSIQEMNFSDLLLKDTSGLYEKSKPSGERPEKQLPRGVQSVKFEMTF